MLRRGVFRDLEGQPLGVQLDILGGGDAARAAYSGIASNAYVPILKFKAAECLALRALLQRHDHPRVVPLLEALPSDDDRDAASYVDSSISRLLQAWPDRPALFDTSYVAGRFEEPLLRAIVDCRLPLILILPSDRPMTDIETLAAYASKLDIGAAIRMRLSLSIDTEDIHGRLQQVQAASGLPAQALDLILDYGYVEREMFMPVGGHVRRLLPALEPLNAWRSLVLASSAFPPDLRHVARYRLQTIERLDWQLWRQLVRTRRGRPPSFSDYTIANPAAPPGGRQAPHNLRYATEEDWIVLKGVRPVKGAIDSDFMTLCEDFAKSGRFKGEKFSWGDEFIQTCVRTGDLRGNATSWRAVGVSHHLHTVLQQLGLQTNI